MLLANLPIGTAVWVYAHGGAVQLRHNPNYQKVRATVVAEHYPNGIQFKDAPSRILLGWEEDKPGVRNRATAGLDYNYSRDNGYNFGMFGIFGINYYDQWEGSANYNVYKIHTQLGRFVYGKWLAFGTEIHSVEDDHFGQGPLAAPTLGNIPFIKGSEVRPGDTIAWYNEDREINYAYVIATEEGEDITETPVAVLECKVFCKDGLRSYPHGYPLPLDANVLLLNRANQ
jgi:hypothetical protein